VENRKTSASFGGRNADFCQDVSKVKRSEAKCGDVKCNEVIENLKGVKPKGRKVK
jgi:hypothetical protein